MTKLIFDPEGNLVGMNKGKSLCLEDFSEESKQRQTQHLEFLEDVKLDKPSRKFWSLYSGGKEQEPLTFSNGKTQEDVIEEIHTLVKEGSKVIFLKGACGTGKSAIALNLARLLGKTSIVVPTKNLQIQYEEDYTSKKYLAKPDGTKLKIATLTGKANHWSLFIPGEKCSSPILPENIDLREEKNYEKLKQYFDMNPNNKGKLMPEIWNLKRLMIAPANPYWSPIYDSEYDLNLDYNKRIEYKGPNGKKLSFYWREKGCVYYDQYIAYSKADVLVFNSAKYLSEIITEKKPATELEIFDEGDEFLDSLFQQKTINLSKLPSALRFLPITTDEGKETIKKMLEIIRNEEKNKNILGVDENKIYNINETKIKELLKLFVGEVKNEISTSSLKTDANKALDASIDFKEVIDDVHLTYSKREEELYVHMVCTDIAARLKKIKDQSKVLIFMSGTLHSEKVLRELFGFKNFEIVEAEPINPGSAEVKRVGNEFKCDYTNMRARREQYLRALDNCIVEAKRPVLIQVSAFADLPSEKEKMRFGAKVPSMEAMKSEQYKDKLGRNVTQFKKGVSNCLYSTRATRGLDFPGETCNSIIFTKYPYPNINSIFWKVLRRTHPDIYWDFYNDKALRELRQRMYRALRSKKDHVYVLSPDIRVLDAVKNSK